MHGEDPGFGVWLAPLVLLLTSDLGVSTWQSPLFRVSGGEVAGKGGEVAGKGGGVF